MNNLRTFRPAKYVWGTLIALACVGDHAWAEEAPSSTLLRAAVLARVREHTMELSYAEAQHDLASLPISDGPDVQRERARLALYEQRYDEAVQFAQAADAENGDTKQLLEIAQGAARVSAATPRKATSDAKISIQFQDPGDEVLFDVLAETAKKAQALLSQDLGIDWPSTLHVLVVRDHLSLSAVTGLPYEAAQTTGTVAVAKWGRVTILSPRAMRHGYGYRDTLAHEITHLAVTRASADRAPLWLQEGVAKREETRWREPNYYDGKISPEALAKRGDELKLSLPLDGLGPSIAMLPTAEQSTVAYAEVTSFVNFLVASPPQKIVDATRPPGAVPQLLRALAKPTFPWSGPRAVTTGAGAGDAFPPIDGDAGVPPASGKDTAVEQALIATTGAGLGEWDKRWRHWLAQQPTTRLPAAAGLNGHGAVDADIGQRTRLAVLLLGRGHPVAAEKELSVLAARGAFAVGGGHDDDAPLRTLRARAAFDAGRPQDAQKLLADPASVSTPFGPFFAFRGRVGNESWVEPSFRSAWDEDPLGIETACRAVDPQHFVPSPACSAAQERRLVEPYGD